MIDIEKPQPERAQQTLFNDSEIWTSEWHGMPEFIQHDLTSFRSIIIHFRSADDVKEFIALLGQHITPKQQSAWFPHMPHRIASDKRYADES